MTLTVDEMIDAFTVAGEDLWVSPCGRYSISSVKIRKGPHRGTKRKMFKVKVGSRFEEVSFDLFTKIVAQRHT